MKQVIISRIKIDENNNEQVIVLKECEGNRFLPVVIGMTEIAAIKFKLRGLEPPRPMTHDLLFNIVRALDAKVKRVIIDKIDGKTFYAKIVIENSKTEEVLIDARPSDSIALALRAESSIFVAEEVLAEAGISI